jgi:hypothetical protein
MPPGADVKGRPGALSKGTSARTRRNRAAEPQESEDDGTEKEHHGTQGRLDYGRYPPRAALSSIAVIKEREKDDSHGKQKEESFRHNAEADGQVEDKRQCQAADPSHRRQSLQQRAK